MSKKSKEVDTYIRNLRDDRREALEQLRALVFDLVPDAEESVSYRMPTYSHRDGFLCAFASQK